jgi:hypothetical protein
VSQRCTTKIVEALLAVCVDLEGHNTTQTAMVRLMDSAVRGRGVQTDAAGSWLVFVNGTVGP